MSGSALDSVIVFGILYGCSFALIALGFTLLFGVSRLLNMVYGGLYMVAAYMMYFFAVQEGWSVFPAAAVSVLIAVGVGLGMHVGFTRVTVDPMRFLIATLLAALFLQYFFSNYFLGSAGLLIPGLVANQSVLVLGVSVDYRVLLAAIVSVILLLLLYLWIDRTSYGQAVRATAGDPETATLFGVNPVRIQLTIVAVSSAIIGVAAILVVPYQEVIPTMWVSPFVIAFVVTVIAGLGKIPWVLPAAFVLSFSEQIAQNLTQYSVTDIAAFAVAIIFVIVLPRGLGGIYSGQRTT